MLCWLSSISIGLATFGFSHHNTPYIFHGIDFIVTSFPSPESVIKRFEQRDHAVDSRGVAEYLKALVVTNAIAEYLPDEQTGKPSSLPTLVIKHDFSLLFFMHLSNSSMDILKLAILQSYLLGLGLLLLFQSRYIMFQVIC